MTGNAAELTRVVRCWHCDGTGQVQECDEHWWVPDTSGMTQMCGLCGAPRRWIKKHGNA